MDEKKQCPKCGVWMRRGETHSCIYGGPRSPFIFPDTVELISKTLQDNQTVFDPRDCNILAEVICEKLKVAKLLKD